MRWSVTLAAEGDQAPPRAEIVAPARAAAAAERASTASARAAVRAGPPEWPIDVAGGPGGQRFA